MVSCGLFSKLSKSSSVKTMETDMRSMYTAGLSPYTLACEKDPDLKSFDMLLHQQTNGIMRSLSAHKGQPLSIETLAEAFEMVLKMNEEAVTLIIKNREEVRKNKDLKALVAVYFKSSSTTFSFYNTVEESIKRAEESQLILQLAVKQFEKESDKNMHPETWEKLEKFKDMGDPFEGDFLHQYASVYAHQVLLLKELCEHKVKLDKKQRKAKVWARVLNVVYIIALVSFLVLSVTLAAVAAPEVLSALASALTHPTEYGGKWCSELWLAYENALEKERGLALSMALQTIINREAVKSLVKQVEKLRSTIASIVGLVELAKERKEDEHLMKVVMQDVDKKVGTFEWRIKKATHLIAFGRSTLGIP